MRRSPMQAGSGLVARKRPYRSDPQDGDRAQGAGHRGKNELGPTGTRSATLWSLSEATKRPLADILSATKAAGYDMAGVVSRKKQLFPYMSHVVTKLAAP